MTEDLIGSMVRAASMHWKRYELLSASTGQLRWRAADELFDDRSAADLALHLDRHLDDR